MSYLLFIHALVCSLIALRVALFQRHGKAHRPVIAFFAYLIVVAAGVVPICIVFGLYPQAYCATLILLGIFCITVFSMRGNIAYLLQHLSCIYNDKIRRDRICYRPVRTRPLYTNTSLARQRVQKI
mgnify:CR=1 FL=1